MAFFGLFGNKPAQPAQPISGGIETGIPAGSDPAVTEALKSSNLNTMGGLIPTTPVIESAATVGMPVVSSSPEIKPLTGLEPFGEPDMSSVQATQNTMTAEKSAATPSSTPPMGTFGVSPTPEALSPTQDANQTIATEEVTPPPAAPETPLVPMPIETPATPVSEVIETTAPDTGPSTEEPVMETQASVVSPVSPVIETPPSPPPPFSMDAITKQPETQTPSAEPVDERETPTAPEETLTSPAAVTSEPAPGPFTTRGWFAYLRVVKDTILSLPDKEVKG